MHPTAQALHRQPPLPLAPKPKPSLIETDYERINILRTENRLYSDGFNPRSPRKSGYRK